tara:strand:- start:15830 stop:16543 length:714 start_codon:yes stop_codon:yes gene_type:complete
MRDDNSTTELKIELNVAGRPARRITRDNFANILSDLDLFVHKDFLALNTKNSKEVADLQRLVDFSGDVEKDKLYRAIKKISYYTEEIKLCNKLIEKLSCEEGKDLSDDLTYKSYKQEIEEHQFKIDDYKLDLSDKLDGEISQLQEIVNNIPLKIWNKILTARRQRFSKRLNKKCKIDINASIYRVMRDEKEKHGLSWDEYMSSLLALSKIEKGKAEDKLGLDWSNSTFKERDEMKWL